MARLKLVVDGRVVRAFVLVRKVTTLGRQNDRDIVINNLALSRRHAEIRLEEGRYLLVDTGSQNGVFVNDERIEGPYALSDQDRFRLGTYVFVFDEESSFAPSASDPKSTSDDSSALLVLKFNDVEMARYPLALGESCLIGRSKEADLHIPERRLSRRHCEIRFLPEGGWIFDLGSQNGSFVNRKRIDEKQALHSGDILNFAEYSVCFWAQAADYDGPDSPREFAKTPKSQTPPASASLDTMSPQTPAIGLSQPEKPQGPSLAGIQPLVERPKAARQRKAAQAIEASAVDPRANRARPASPERTEDVDDLQPERKPDPALDRWYASRDPNPEIEAEAHGLLERSPSTVSELLSTMMPGQGELAESLHLKPERRRFGVRVSSKGQTFFEGPLTQEVTILGRDAEADIELRGRYVAGRHSLLILLRDSLLLVRLGSSSAARVNGHAKLQAFLRPGDRIQIDETTLDIYEAD